VATFDTNRSADQNSKRESEKQNADIDSTATQSTVFYGSASDRPADRDSLGFEPYVKSLADFLISWRTRPPLTVSIEGPWGSGKSSFMLLLQQELQARLVEKWQIIEFNAWRHDKEEALWAAFALAFVRQLRKNVPFWSRLKGSISLFCLRFRFSDGWTSLLRVAFMSTLLVTCAISIPILVWQHGSGWATNLVDKLAKAAATPAPSPSPSSSGNTPSSPRKVSSENGSRTESEKKTDPLYDIAKLGIQTGGWTGTVTLVAYLFYLIAKAIGNPFEIKLRKHLSTPDYEGRTSFIENFHNDFKYVLDAYVKLPSSDRPEDLNKTKIYVFIDDLDRCDLPKAAELMNAINLLISDDQRLIFVLGIDRQKVAAAIAFKYKDLLSFLPRSTASLPNASQGATQRQSDNQERGNNNHSEELRLADAGLNFGYSFLNKFIQVPFILPAPGREELKQFLQNLSVPPSSTPHNPISEQAFDPGSPDQNEAPYVSRIALWIAESFSNNPRRLKQFINLFRLRLHVARRTETLGSGEGLVTPEQLGKITAIMLQWPGFVEAWLADPWLLTGLQLAALKPLREADQKDPWFGSLELRRFLLLDPTGRDYGLSEDARLDGVSLDAALRIASPKLVTRSTEQARALLNRLTKGYEQVRAEVDHGPARIQAMNAIFWQMQKLILDATLLQKDIHDLYNGSDGQRIAAFAMIQMKPATEFLTEIVSSIENPRSAYEQYRALRSATELEPQLAKQQPRSSLRQAIVNAYQTGRLPKEEDKSRHDLAQRLLDRL
jgi:hypothetical protein